MSERTYRGLFGLYGKVAMVTGEVGMLGQHFRAELAKSGARVAIMDLLEWKPKEFASSLVSHYKAKVIGTGCNVSNRESVQEMVQRVMLEFGRLTCCTIMQQGSPTIWMRSSRP